MGDEIRVACGGFQEELGVRDDATENLADADVPADEQCKSHREERYDNESDHSFNDQVEGWRPAPDSYSTLTINPIASRNGNDDVDAVLFR